MEKPPVVLQPPLPPSLKVSRAHLKLSLVGDNEFVAKNPKGIALDLKLSFVGDIEFVAPNVCYFLSPEAPQLS